MKLSDKLKQSRAAKAEQAQAIYNAADAAGRQPTAEETTQFNTLMDEVRALSTRIDAQIELERVTSDVPATPNAATRPNVDVNGNSPSQRAYTPAFPVKNFRKPHAGRTPEENAFRSGKWLQAILGNRQAMQYCQENGIFAYGSNQVALEIEAAAQRTGIYNAHSEGSNSAGGFLVPDEFEAAVINLRDTYGVARRFCDVKNMSSDYHVQPKRLTGLTATARAEEGAVTESSKTWGQVALTAKSWDLLSKFSRELNEDAVISIADDLTGEAAIAFAYAEDNSLFNGDGSGTYNSITGLYTIWFNQWAGSETYKGGVTTATHDLPTEVDATDLAKVIGQIAPWAKQMGRCRWFCSPEYAAAIFDRLTGAAGGNNAFDLAAGRPRTYAGYPVTECLTAPANDYTTAQDEKPMLWFGDMASAVRFGNRRGMTVQILNELYAANGQIGIIASERFDINVHNYGSTSVKSPLVAFMGETS